MSPVPPHRHKQNKPKLLFKWSLYSLNAFQTPTITTHFNNWTGFRLAPLPLRPRTIKPTIEPNDHPHSQHNCELRCCCCCCGYAKIGCICGFSFHWFMHNFLWGRGEHNTKQRHSLTMSLLLSTLNRCILHGLPLSLICLFVFLSHFSIRGEIRCRSFLPSPDLFLYCCTCQFWPPHFSSLFLFVLRHSIVIVMHTSANGRCMCVYLMLAEMNAVSFEIGERMRVPKIPNWAMEKHIRESNRFSLLYERPGLPGVLR